MKEKTFINKVKDNLAIILVITSIISGCVWVQARLSAVEAKAQENKETLKQLEAIKTNVYLLCVNNNLECIK